MSRNIYESSVNKVAMIPAVVADADVNGLAIANPWSVGRRILFTIIAAAFAAADIITVRVQVQDKAGNWTNAKEEDGTTDLAFTAAVDTGSLENGSIYGEINLERMAEGSVSKAMRLVALNDAVTDVIVGATYQIGWLYERPPVNGEDADEDLMGKQIWTNR